MFKLLSAAALTVSLLSADTRVKSTITAAGQTTETVVLTKGNRQRLEFGQDAVLIQQCDRKRTLQVDARRFARTAGRRGRDSNLSWRPRLRTRNCSLSPPGSALNVDGSWMDHLARAWASKPALSWVSLAAKL